MLEIELGFVERVVRGETAKTLLEEHTERYRFTGKLLRGRVALDAACGSGYGLAILANSGAARVIGLDASERAIRLAKKEACDPRIAIIRGDVTRLPIKSKVIDVAVCLETIEHLDDPAICLREMYRVLRETGCAVVSTPNKSVVSPNSASPRNPYHVREFTVSEFEALLQGLFSSVSLYGQTPRGNRRALNVLLSISYVLHRLGLHAFLERLRRMLEAHLRMRKAVRMRWTVALLQCPFQVAPLSDNADTVPTYLTAHCEKAP